MDHKEQPKLVNLQLNRQDLDSLQAQPEYQKLARLVKARADLAIEDVQHNVRNRQGKAAIYSQGQADALSSLHDDMVSK